MSGPFPEDSAARKTYPVFSGVLQYFPAAIARVAHHSYLGNEKHNLGQPLHWARGKSDDHLDAAGRHLTEGDLEGAAWRILAALQLKCEAEGAPVAPGARVADQDLSQAIVSGFSMLGVGNGKPLAPGDTFQIHTDPHTLQYSVSTTPAGAQSGEIIDTTRTAYQGKNYPSNSDGS